MRITRKLLALEPWLEDAHTWLMRLLALSGRRVEALAQYETCKRILAEELGVEPVHETRILYEQIRKGTFDIPASTLPVAVTAFVGRSRELAEIAGLLADVNCRLLTLTGLGGVGKTRLALEVAVRQHGAFAHGIHYVDLSIQSAPERIAETLSQSLDIRLTGSADPRITLLAILREKEMLIVLDGFEHILEGAVLLTEILQAAPGIKILVTSHERLGLRGEWVYTLTGLAFALDGQHDALTSFDAEELFLQTARRINLRFQVRPDEREYLLRICSLVEGVPLAIELAAAWVRVLSLEEIAVRIGEHQDILATTMRDHPRRHRSIRAVFDQSWQLLTANERDVFCKLSVFQGSFRTQEADRVCGASLPLLSALVDKSLIQRLLSGRYHFHTLLRQYAKERFEQMQDAVELTRDLHCKAYADRLAPYKQSLKGLKHVSALELIGEDTPNVLDAWRWAIQRRNYDVIGSMNAGLADYYQATTSFREGEFIFRKALEDLGWLRGIKEHSVLFCQLLSSQATFLIYLGRFSEARTYLEQCLEIFSQNSIQDEMAHCQFFLGEIARFSRDYTLAKDLFALSLTNYQQGGNRSAVGFCLNGLGLVYAGLGELPKAHLTLQDSLKAFGDLDHKMGQAIASINLADLLIKLGDRAAARRILDEGYAVCQQLGHRWGMAVCLRHLGDIARLEVRNEDAKAAYWESLGILQDIGQRQASTGCFIDLGKVCVILGEVSEAKGYLKRAISITADIHDQEQMLEVTEILASLLAEEGDGERALELALLVARTPMQAPPAQERLQHLVTTLTYQIPDASMQRLQKESRQLEDILRDI